MMGPHNNSSTDVPNNTEREATPSQENQSNRPAFRSPRERRESRRGEHSSERLSTRKPIDAVLQAMLVVIVSGSVLAVGSVHVRTLLVVGLASVVGGVLALLVHRRDVGTWPVVLPAGGVFVLTLWTAFQAIPLPASLVELVASDNADIWKHALDPLGEPGPAWHPISLDPGATWVETLKGVTYTSVVLLSAVVAYRRGSPFGVGTVFVSALAVGFLTIAHGLAGMSKVFGIYEPVYFSMPWQMGPLLNANHLAGYLNLGVMCGLGVFLARRPKVPRWLMGIGTATLAALAVLAASRGAIVLLPVGVALVVALVRFGKKPQASDSVPRRWLVWLTAATIACGAVLAGLGFTSAHWKALFNDDISKLSIVSWARPLVVEHAWVGIGRGAFETVYPAYRPNQGHLLWTHPENIVVQWTSEWGIPLAIVAMLFFAYLLARMGATRSAVAAGAVAGIVVVALQNLVDFSLEMAGVAVAVMALVGSCWGDTQRRGVGRTIGLPRSRSMGRRWLAIGFAVFGLLGVLMVATRGMRTALDDRTALYEFTKTAPIRAKFDPQIRAAMLRRPAEPYLPLMGAERAWHGRDANPIPYLQRVLSRSKRYGRAHMLLAEILFARGAWNQALMELKFACEDEPALATPAVALAVRSNIHGKDFERMVPDGPDGLRVLDTLGAWMRTRDPELGRRFDEIVLKEDPTRLGPRERRARDRVAALGQPDNTLCAGEEKRRECVAHIEQDAEQMEKHDPTSLQAARLRADAFMALGRPEAADRALAEACDRVSDRSACLRARVPIVASLGREEQLDELLETVAAAGCANSRTCAQTHVWIGQYQRSRKHFGAAVNAFRRATVYDPQELGAWTGLGDASALLGLNAQAAMAYERASRLSPADAELRAKYDKARKEATFYFPSHRILR